MSDPPLWPRLQSSWLLPPLQFLDETQHCPAWDLASLVVSKGQMIQPGCAERLTPMGYTSTNRSKRKDLLALSCRLLQKRGSLHSHLGKKSCTLSGPFYWLTYFFSSGCHEVVTRLVMHHFTSLDIFPYFTSLLFSLLLPQVYGTNTASAFPFALTVFSRETSHSSPPSPH